MNTLGVLRPIREYELELMLTWRNAPSVRRYMFSSNEISTAEHYAWWDKIKSDPSVLFLMLEIDSQPIGIVNFTSIDRKNDTASWGAYLSPEAPRGTGSKMEFLTFDYAFDRLNLHKLYGDFLAFNTKIMRLHQKFGFKIEGIFREQHRIGTEYCDVYRGAILKREWKLMREELLSALLSKNEKQG